MFNTPAVFNVHRPVQTLKTAPQPTHGQLLVDPGSFRHPIKHTLRPLGSNHAEGERELSASRRRPASFWPCEEQRDIDVPAEISVHSGKD